MKSLKVCTLNVRRFSHPESVQLIGLCLKKFVPDFVCLNEVDLSRRSDSLDELTRFLGENYSSHFFGHVQGVYGNAILFQKSMFHKFEIKEHLMPGGTTIVLPKGSKHFVEADHVHEEQIKKRIIRGLIEFTNGEFTFLCSHLDHIKETERVVQAEYLAKLIRERNNNCFVLGDLNCVNHADYSEEEMVEIAKHHEENKWDFPADSGGETGALSVLKEAGMVDCFAEGVKGDLSKLDSNLKLTAHTNHPLYRIDYVMCNKKTLESFEVKSGKVGTELKVSDHFPVFVSLVRKSTNTQKSLY